MYTTPEELVLDPMVGPDATFIGARLLGRNCTGADVSYSSVILMLHRLYRLEESAKKWSSNHEPAEVDSLLKTWS